MVSTKFNNNFEFVTKQIGRIIKFLKYYVLLSIQCGEPPSINYVKLRALGHGFV